MKEAAVVVVHSEPIPLAGPQEPGQPQQQKKQVQNVPAVQVAAPPEEAQLPAKQVPHEVAEAVPPAAEEEPGQPAVLVVQHQEIVAAEEVAVMQETVADQPTVARNVGDSVKMMATEAAIGEATEAAIKAVETQQAPMMIAT